MGITTKSHRVNRSEFLQALEAVRPGLSPKPLVEHSNSFCFRGGRVEAFNDEVACRFRTKLPKEIVGVVASKSLLAYLNKIPDEVIDIKVNEETKSFTILGRGKKTDFLVAFEKTFEIDKVERPYKENWVELSPRFGDAIGMVAECAKKDASDSVLTCVHIHPDFVEASDETQWCRVRLRTKTKEPFLVKKDAIRHIVNLDMTEMAQTDSWIHFRNPAGLVFSCRRKASKFPDVSHLLEPIPKAKRMTLPKELAEDAGAVNVAASEDKDANAIVVELEPGKFCITGLGVTIKAKHWKKCDYSGKPLAFMIQPDMLVQITKREKTCLIGRNRMKMKGDFWNYLVDLAEPIKVQKAAKANIKPEEVDDE